MENSVGVWLSDQLGVGRVPDAVDVEDLAVAHLVRVVLDGVLLVVVDD